MKFPISLARASTQLKKAASTSSTPAAYIVPARSTSATSDKNQVQSTSKVTLATASSTLRDRTVLSRNDICNALFTNSASSWTQKSSHVPGNSTQHGNTKAEADRKAKIERHLKWYKAVSVIRYDTCITEARTE